MSVTHSHRSLSSCGHTHYIKSDHMDQDFQIRIIEVPVNQGSDNHGSILKPDERYLKYRGFGIVGIVLCRLVVRVHCKPHCTKHTLWSNVEYFHHTVYIFLLCGMQFTYTLQLAA